MQSLNIQKPAIITEGKAMQAILEAFKQAMSKAENVVKMSKGNALEIILSDDLVAYVAETWGQAKASGLYTVKIYRPQDHSPLAHAFCDEYDL